jgi:hypothetical protein
VVTIRDATLVLTRIRGLATARQILFTLKARRELAALELGLDEQTHAMSFRS